ncbi:MAG TPA: A24 family peptidase, partial [Acidimicrobiales bacterium]|nr:A24 family peptidase [Acidimicrobiales bacterium]
PVQPWLLGDRAGPRRRLAVELATAATFAALAAQYGDSSVVLPMLVLGAALVAVSFVDLEHLRIPDRLTFPALAVAIPLVVAVSIERDATDALRGAAVGAVAYFAILFVAHLVSPRGMGFGDVKLALLLGLYLGWVGWRPGETLTGPVQYVFYGLMLGCVLGIAFGLAHRAITKDTGGFPFGPALAVSCVVILLWLP